MKNKEMRAAIYIRVSTLDQAREGYSLESQESTLRKWCLERKYIVYDLYADRGISGKDFDHRPDMLRLMRDAKEGRFQVVVFWALSRFTRSVQDLYSTLEKFQKWNISMVSYTEYCGYNVFRGELYKGNHEPIISIEMFNRVQRLLKQQGKALGRTRIKQINYLPTKGDG